MSLNVRYHIREQFMIVNSFLIFLSVTTILTVAITCSLPLCTFLSQLSDGDRVRRDCGVRTCGVRTSTSVDYQR